MAHLEPKCVFFFHFYKKTVGHGSTVAKLIVTNFSHFQIRKMTLRILESEIKGHFGKIGSSREVVWDVCAWWWGAQ